MEPDDDKDFSATSIIVNGSSFSFFTFLVLTCGKDDDAALPLLAFSSLVATRRFLILSLLRTVVVSVMFSFFIYRKKLFHVFFTDTVNFNMKLYDKDYVNL